MIELRYEPSNLTIQFHEDGRWVYEIDCEDLTTSARVLDWVAQLSRKTWMSDADLGRLVRLLDELLDLQASLCGFGEEHGPVKVAEIIPKVEAARQLAAKALRKS